MPQVGTYKGDFRNGKYDGAGTLFLRTGTSASGHVDLPASVARSAGKRRAGQPFAYLTLLSEKPVLTTGIGR